MGILDSGLPLKSYWPPTPPYNWLGHDKFQMCYLMIYLFDAECLVHRLILVAVVTEHLLSCLQVIQGNHSHDGAQHWVRREQSVPGQQGIMNDELDLESLG